MKKIALILAGVLIILTGVLVGLYISLYGVQAEQQKTTYHVDAAWRNGIIQTVAKSDTGNMLYGIFIPETDVMRGAVKMRTEEGVYMYHIAVQNNSFVVSLNGITVKEGSINESNNLIIALYMMEEVEECAMRTFLLF